MKISTPLIFCLLLVSYMSHAQESVDINFNVKHSVKGVSTFDRSKYIVLHAGSGDPEWNNDAQAKQFLEDYDVYIGRSNGELPWNYSQCKEDANKPGWPDIAYLENKGQQSRDEYAKATHLHDRESRNVMMVGGQMNKMFPNGQKTSPKPHTGFTPWASAGYEAMAEYYAQYAKNFYGTGGTTGSPRPKMIEVLNEPFVHAHEYNTTPLEISKMHSVVAKRIHELNPDVMVGGYTAAHPEFEAGDFNLWKNNWKQFIDQAGEDMDFYSVHLYDVIPKNKPNIERQRKGSNMEAILDMIEHYSYLKVGEVKPFGISEYGWFAPDMDGTPYTKQRDWWNLRSFSSMMMQLMERPDQIVSAIPFQILKANWWNSPNENKYPYRLLRQKKELEGETGEEWVYTELIKFFQLWSDVKGTRIDTQPSNLDVQVDAYVDGKKAYVILNCHEKNEKEITLNLFGADDNIIESIKVKHLFADENGIPKFTTETITDLNEVMLKAESTMILEYTFMNDVVINETSEEDKIYADKYLQPITAGSTKDFAINGVAKGIHGEAVLRVGIGRDHGKSLKPTIKVNGHNILVPSNWRGYDQKNRDRFFGVIEIPVPYEFLAENNTVSVKFSDSNGYITSLSIQTFQFSAKIDRTKKIVLATNEVKRSIEEKIVVTPNPVVNELKFVGLKQHQYNVGIYNLSGKKINSVLLNGNTNSINVSNLAQGVYIARFISEGGEQTIKFKKQ